MRLLSCEKLLFANYPLIISSGYPVPSSLEISDYKKWTRENEEIAERQQWGNNRSLMKRKRKMALFGPNLKWKETQKRPKRTTRTPESYIIQKNTWHRNKSTSTLIFIWQLRGKVPGKIKMLQLCCNSKKRMVAAVALLAGWRGFPIFIHFHALFMRFEEKKY